MEQIGVIVFGLKGCGKSTLCGHILYRYGVFNDKTLNKAKAATKKLNKENCEYAFLCDSRESDRKNGTSSTKIFELLIASQIYNLTDSCSADNEKRLNRLIRYGFGQTRIGILILEAYCNKDILQRLIDKKSDIHQQLTMAHTFGIQQLIICINKIDKDNIEFTEDLYNYFCDKIKLMLTAIGYNSEKVPIIPICSYSGDNLFKTSKDQSLNWWKENGFQIKSTSNDAKIHKITTLVKAIKYMTKKIKPLNVNIITKNTLCMTIKSRIENKKIGPILLGRIDSGQIMINQTILCCKSRESAFVRKYNMKSMQSHNKNIKIAKTGSVIGFTLSPNPNDIDKKDQPDIGDIVCNGNQFRISILERNINQIDYAQCLPKIIKYENSLFALIVILSEEFVNKTTLKIEAKAFNHNLIFRTQTLNCSLLSILAKCKRNNNNVLEKKEDFNELTNGDEAEVVFSTNNQHFVSRYDAFNSYSRFFIIKDKIPIAIGKVIGIGTGNNNDIFSWNGSKCMKNTCIGRVSIGKKFVVEFTMIIHSKIGNNWENIFHIGHNDNVRSPGFWLHPGSYKLHVRLSDVNDWNKGYDPDILLTKDEKYKIRLESKDYFVTLSINDKLYSSGNSTHKQWYMAPIWVSDPWYDAADVTIQNLTIYVP